MIPLKDFQTIKNDDYFHDAVEALDGNHWGGVFIVNKDNHANGIFTDGDARRVLLKNQNPLAQLNATEITKYMTKDPKVVLHSEMILDVFKMMNESGILVVPVVDEEKKIIGLVHIQHIAKEFLKSL